MSNGEVLDRIGTGRKIWKTTIKTRVRMIRLNRRHSGLVSHMLEGMIEHRKTKTKLCGVNNGKYRIVIIFLDEERLTQNKEKCRAIVN